MIRGLALVLLLPCGLGCRGEEEPAPVPTVPTVPATAPEPVCEEPALRVAVQAGDYLHAVAGQESQDVTLTLSDAGGRQLLQVDSPTAASVAPWPAEEIHWVADAPGEVRVEMAPTGFRGPCGLRLEERRPATAADRARALAEAELARAHGLRRRGSLEECRAGVPLYESAERRFADLGLPRRRAEALLGLGLLQRERLGDEGAAFQTFSRAARLFTGDPAFEAVVRQHLGGLRYERGDVDGAIREYRRALALSRRIGDRRLELLAAGRLALPVQMRGHYDEAATLFDHALALGQPGDGTGDRAVTLLNRGHLHRQLGEVERARERFDEALGLFRQVRDPGNEAAALNALGLLAQDRGQLEAALGLFREALELRPADSRGRAVTLTSIGVIERRLGRLEEARRAYAEALPIFRRLGDVREEANSLGNLGRLESRAGQDAAALASFDQALRLSRRLADAPDLAWILEGQAGVLRRRGDLEAARGLQEEALAAVEGHRFRQTSYATRAAFFAAWQDSYDFLIDLLLEMHRKEPAAGHAAAALEVHERSLARSLLDGLAARGIGPPSGAVPELQAREREVEKEIDVLVSRQARLAEDAAPPQQLRPVEAELARRWDELDRVRGELRAADPRYAALTQPRPWSAAEIQRELLDPDTLLLEYRLGEERSLLWAVTPDSLASFELPARAEIEERVLTAWDLLSRGHRRTAEIAVRPRLAELSRLLLGPVAPLLPGKRLVIVVDGALQILPFAALPEPGAGAGGEPLVAGHEIVTLPSMSVLGVLRREAIVRPRAAKTLWVLADPEFGGRFRRLEHSAREAEALLALVPAAERAAVLGREASRAAVLNSPLRDYRYLHFATHGSFAPTEPGGGRLVLAQTGSRGGREANGFLHLADIYELDLRADLVVLSACQSAWGREVRGEGMNGMTRGFFYAGAERVVVSLWNVDDRVTAELMRRFYQGMLVEGLSPAAALRAAQDEVRRQQLWRAPYHWAGFTLQGEWRRERPR